MKDFIKKNFIAGILVTVPLVATFLFLKFFINALDGILLIFPFSLMPKVLTTIPGFGLVVSVLLIMIMGALARNYLGNQFIEWWTQFVSRIPIVRSIYSAVQQLMDTLMYGKKNQLRSVVMIEFPKPGVHMLGFITGTSSKEMNVLLGGDFINVFIPSSPNPTTGVFIVLHKNHVTELKMSVEAALKYIISCGIVNPEELSKIEKS